MGYPVKTLNGSTAQTQLVTGQGLLVYAHANALNSLRLYDGTSSSTGVFLGIARIAENLGIGLSSENDPNVIEWTHPVQFKVGLYAVQNAAGSTFSVGVI